MINTVVWDLRVFLFVYAILLFFFSQVFAVLGVNNRTIDGDLKDYFEYLKVKFDTDDPSGYPGEEYKHIHPFLGYLFSTLRISLGDNDFSGQTYLTKADDYVFWIVWFVVVILTCVVFLNFIIAEASASY